MVNLNINRDACLFRISQQFLLVILLLLGVSEHLITFTATLSLRAHDTGAANPVSVVIQYVVLVVAGVF